MSNDIMPCGCEGHADNEGLCRYPMLETAATRAAAELRHAYGNASLTGQRIDPNLVSRAIALLETALKGKTP